ncbi:hypothetical protein BDN70DRAFT_814888 [Pholiota conissans]|uniref:Uncharacterized protein n=1 Tax=Pholiota conissans TaxID=109636 RepID=A0A9P5YSW1_9AGAR|nr:hypothetical protein BDN70DRAFT_814888 [Pholiota conissans]
MAIERRRRTARPCDLPAPSRPLWPTHDAFYDDYWGGPTQEDLHAFEDPHHDFPLYDPILSSIYIKSPWTYFRDYGYRLMRRFGHSYYSCPPMLLEMHVMPLVPEFSVNKCIYHFQEMHFSPRPLGRTGIPELRVVSSSDVDLLGASEILERVKPSSEGEEQNPNTLISYFLRGKNEEGDYICLDLERDAVHSSQFEIDMSVDIDSFVWVTDLARVASPVGLMVTPCFRNNSGIKKHNHIYAEILEPPSDSEASDPSTKSWLERRIALSTIPHTLFTKITEGNSPIYCYIFFPRMIHRNEYTGKRETSLPMEVLIWFWDNVVLPALYYVVNLTALEPFYEYTVEEYIRKRAGKNPGKKDSLYSGFSKQVDPATFSQIQNKMRDILDSFEDTQKMDRFKSFFFVLECKGFKLNVISPDGNSVMTNLKKTTPQLNWDYVLNRANGEVHMDIGFNFHPRRVLKKEEDRSQSGLTGLWRMNYLDESFGKSGFKAGNPHHLNTLPCFGALQAEMTVERSRRTHVLYRSAYNLVYEAVRKKDNSPWFCGDGDAYNLTETFQSACEEKYHQYKNRGARSYGVRDEYRVSGVAAIQILASAKDVLKRFKSSDGVLWIPTHIWFEFSSARLKAIEIATMHLYQKSPDNKGLIASLFMHLIRSIESTPTEVPTHVRHTLAALLMRGTTATCGMMFLHDLNLSDNGSETLPGIQQQDDRYIREELELVPKRRPKKFVDRPRITVEYPFGECPTWKQVLDALKKQPLHIIRHWERPFIITHIPTSAGILFVNFTRSLWISIKSDWTEGFLNDLTAVENLDQAMMFWTAENIVNILKAVSISINRCGIKGSVKGTQDAKSFRQRTWIYFPDNNGVYPPRGSKWVAFFADTVGYIQKYHDMLDAFSRDEDKLNLKNGLEDIFGELQCLPDSEPFTATKEGKTWCRAPGEDAISILVSVRHMRFKEIGRTATSKNGPTRSHITRSVKDIITELFKLNGLVEEAKQIQQRRWRAKRKGVNKKKSIRTKNKRAPPKRKRTDDSDEDGDESESEKSQNGDSEGSQNSDNES